jgi:hypothetical protein
LTGKPGDPPRVRYPHLWEFDARIDRHIAATGAEVLVDWRDVTTDGRPEREVFER